MKKKNLCLELCADVHARFKWMAFRKGVPMTELVVLLLEQEEIMERMDYLEQNKGSQKMPPPVEVPKPNFFGRLFRRH